MQEKKKDPYFPLCWRRIPDTAVVPANGYPALYRNGNISHVCLTADCETRIIHGIRTMAFGTGEVPDAFSFIWQVPGTGFHRRFTERSGSINESFALQNPYTHYCNKGVAHSSNQLCAAPFVRSPEELQKMCSIH